MRWPLRYQILFPFAGVMLAVVVGVSVLDAVLAARRTQRQIEHQLSEVSHTLSEANFPLTDAVLRQTRGLSGAEFLLVDKQGRLQAASLEHVDPARIPAPMPSDDGLRLGAPLELAGTSYLHTSVGLSPRGSRAEEAWLHILYPQDFLREARWQAAYPPLIVGSLLLVVVVGLATAIAGRLTRPILELRRELSQLLAGNFQPLALPRRNDELRDLVGSVNQLGDQLDELHRVIKRSERLAILGQLSGGLAHQMRNAVTGARMALQLHGRHCKQVDQESLTVAARQLSMTESHLERFLAIGRPTAPRRADCDLHAVLADVAALVGPACQHRKVDLQLPDPNVVDGHLWADADQLKQLLLNLVLNALEAAAIEAAGPGGWVRIELVRESHRPNSTLAPALRLRVFDSGPGIDPSLAVRLFEPFATGKPEGIGLGLAVARQIAGAHGGTIEYLESHAVDARPTCFEVTLPLAEPAPRGEPTVLRSAEPTLNA